MGVWSPEAWPWIWLSKSFQNASNSTMECWNKPFPHAIQHGSNQRIHDRWPILSHHFFIGFESYQAAYNGTSHMKFRALKHRPRAMSMKIKCPCKSTMRNGNLILQLMGLQAYCIGKVDHVERWQHMFRFGPHHDSIIFLGANGILIDYYNPLFCNRLTLLNGFVAISVSSWNIFYLMSCRTPCIFIIYLNSCSPLTFQNL